MLELLHSLGAEALAVFWLPLLTWTLLALPCWWLLERWTGTSALTQYWVRLGLLAALPLGIAGAWTLSAISLPLQPAGEVVDAGILPIVPVVPAGEAAAGSIAWGYLAAGLATVAVLVTAGAGLARLAFDGLSLLRWKRSITLTAPDGRLKDLTRRMARKMDAAGAVRVRLTPDTTLPMTFGIFRPVILIPEMLAGHDGRLCMALAHEMIHVRRRDCLWHAFERVTAALFRLHPLVGRLRRSIETYRELSCDAEVLDRAADSKRAYARLLLTLAEQPAPSPALHGLSMAQPPSSIKQRIEAMKNNNVLAWHSTRLSLISGLLLLVGLALIVACTDLLVQEQPMEPPPPPTPPAPSEGALSTEADTAVFIVVEEMPEPLDGIAGIQERVRYPELARRAGIEGTVYVQFVVNPEGQVEDAEVTRGIGAGCDEEALRVLRETEFTPGRQQGEAVSVRMSIPVRFQLEADSQSRSTPPPPPTPSGDLSDAIDIRVEGTDRVLVGDAAVERKDLEGTLSEEVQRGRTSANVQIDGGAAMGHVHDVQRSLRASEITHVRYANAEAPEGEDFFSLQR